MRRASILFLAAMLTSRAGAVLGVDAPPRPRPVPTVFGEIVVESSLARTVGKSATSFYLYGAPGSGQGDFEDALGGPDFEGWTSEDVTEDEEYWQLSTFNAAQLNDHGEGNIAYWCGQSAEQQPGWAAAPGYGNRWDQRLQWTSGPIADPGLAQTIGLEFVFNQDSEPGYDFLRVEYFKSGAWVQVAAMDGWNQPGPDSIQYPSEVNGALPIVFAGNDYGGVGGDEILLRLRFTSDGAWSDEDGLFNGNGASQVDDVRVTYDDGVGAQESFSDFDVTNAWVPGIHAFAGDFAKVVAGFQDIDECHENRSPILLFVDDGSCPRNPHNNFGQTPCASTGGEPPVHSPAYGVPGGWTVNWHGGLSQEFWDVDNRVVSPPIAWDLPGTADDAPEFRGLSLRFDAWRHLYVADGIFYTWEIRTTDDGGAIWGPWLDDNFVWYGDDPGWITHEADATHLLPETFTHLQVSLRVLDLAQIFAFPGAAATPSPAFDNVQLMKYQLDGPTITAPHTNLWQDAFPQSGQASFATQADRAGADVRLDIPRDLGGTSVIVPGDSVVVEVSAVIPGTTLDGVELVWVLDKNPLFDDVRVTPAATTVVPGGAPNGWDQWTGIVAGRQWYSSPPFRFHFDLPDQDFFHPGDVLRYYVRARDDQGRESTLPSDIDGFATGRGTNSVRYATPFTVHALPSAVDDGQGGISQPWILWIDAAGHQGAGNDRDRVFAEQGWFESSQFDVYTVLAPTTLLTTGNGIGSSGAFGATAAQLASYQAIVFDGGNLDTPLRSDKCDDLGVLRGWFEQDAVRGMVHFGNDLVSSLSGVTGGASYRQDILGVDVFGSDVRDVLSGEANPVVQPVLPYFATEYAAFGGCLHVNETDTPPQWPGFDLTSRHFDDIGPRAGAAVGHQFLDLLGQPYLGPGGAASVVWDRIDNGNRKTSVTFPYGFQYVWEQPRPDADVVAARVELVREILEDAMGVVIPNTGAPTAIGEVPAFRGLRDLAGVPNPFNPRVRISFEIGRRSPVQAEVFNVRGERVLTLLDEERPAGRVELVWDGRDARGAEIASGVYFVRVRGDGQSKVRKVALVR